MNNSQKGGNMNTTWRKRRLKKGLDISEVANYLDMSYERYALIDKGDVKMPNKYIEKFNELINKSKGETSINRLTREETVNVWWSKMCKKEGRGKFGLDEKLREFNISNLAELDRLMGYSSSGASSNYLNRGNNVSYDLKNKYFSFFENELNIQPLKKNTTKQLDKRKSEVSYREDAEYTKLLEWFNSIDFKKWAEDKHLTRDQFKQLSGLSEGSVNNVYAKRHATPYLKTLQKLKDFIDNYTEKPTNKPISQVMTFTSIPTEEVPEDIRRMGRELAREVNENMSLKEKLLAKYNEVIEGIDNDINRYKYMIERLEDKKAFYEQIINDINED